MIFKIATYSVFLNSSSIGAVDDINKAEGIRKVVKDSFIHGIIISHSRAINNDDTLLINAGKAVLIN